ncbi:hypothetical protein TCAL_14754 [Tigriopus californicus]|uniref:Uncharacterized protein n=1 Tax=Tigriopus californicus TaxID=6832 RepID=A0A553PET1_TIGCA|nr:hypothetical protein TCAL_14754 [Tigriopus californicus]
MVRIKSQQVKRRRNNLKTRRYSAASFQDFYRNFLLNQGMKTDTYCCEACEEAKFQTCSTDNEMEDVEDMGLPMEEARYQSLNSEPDCHCHDCEKQCSLRTNKSSLVSLTTCGSSSNVPCLRDPSSTVTDQLTYCWSDSGEDVKPTWNCMEEDNNEKVKAIPIQPIPKYSEINDVDFNGVQQPLEDPLKIHQGPEENHAFHPVDPKSEISELNNNNESDDVEPADVVSVSSDSLDNLKSEEEEMSDQEVPQSKPTSQILKPKNTECKTMEELYDEIPVSSGISVAGDLEPLAVSDFEDERESDQSIDDILNWVLKSEYAMEEAGNQCPDFKENIENVEDNWTQEDIEETLRWLSKKSFSPPVGQTILEIPKEDDEYLKKRNKTDDEQKASEEALLDIAVSPPSHKEESTNIFTDCSRSTSIDQNKPKPRHRIKKRSKQPIRNIAKRRRLCF